MFADFATQTELVAFLQDTQHHEISVVTSEQVDYNCHVRTQLQQMQPRSVPKYVTSEYYDSNVRCKLLEVQNGKSLLDKLMCIYVPLYECVRELNQMCCATLVGRLQPCQSLTKCLCLLDEGSEVLVQQYKKSLRNLLLSTGEVDITSSEIDQRIRESGTKDIFCEPQIFVAPLRCSTEEFPEFLWAYFNQNNSELICLQVIELIINVMTS